MNTTTTTKITLREFLEFTKENYGSDLDDGSVGDCRGFEDYATVILNEMINNISIDESDDDYGDAVADVDQAFSPWLDMPEIYNSVIDYIDNDRGNRAIHLMKLFNIIE